MRRAALLFSARLAFCGAVFFFNLSGKRGENWSCYPASVWDNYASSFASVCEEAALHSFFFPVSEFHKENPSPPAHPGFFAGIVRYFNEFKVLKSVGKDFWYVNAIQFFDGLAYFSMITVITLYLTNNGGFSDFDSGKWVSIYMLYVIAFVFAIGSICDVIGIKKSLYIGVGFLLLARAGLAFAPVGLEGASETFAIKASIILLSLGTAFMGPVTQTALRRFTSKTNRATGFNVYYLLMNIGAMVTNFFLVDFFRNTMGPVEGNVWIMNMGFLATIVVLFLAWKINENYYAEPSERLEKKEGRRPLAIFLEVWREKPFQKLVLFLLLTIGVRLVFTHQSLVMPKYYTRVLYEDFDLGGANSINPAIIVIGLIAVIPIINKYSTMKLMLLGMSISAVSLLVMCLPIHWLLGLPFVHTLTDAYFFAVVTQIMIFAVGELIFMPRFTEYIASVAPKDKVASYMSLAALPMFIAKPINGFVSGILISIFCYDGIRAKIDTGNVSYMDSPEFMWMIYAVLAILSPLAVIWTKRLLVDSSSIRQSREATEEFVENEGAELDREEQGSEVLVFGPGESGEEKR